MSEIRLAIAGELRLTDVLPLTAITPTSANQRGFRDLRDRIREEGDNAPAVATRVLEVLTEQARSKRSIEWLSEKAFSEGAWRHAREAVPKWRGRPAAAQQSRHTVTIDGVDIEVEAAS